MKFLAGHWLDNQTWQAECIGGLLHWRECSAKTKLFVGSRLWCQVSLFSGPPEFPTFGYWLMLVYTFGIRLIRLHYRNHGQGTLYGMATVHWHRHGPRTVGCKLYGQQARKLHHVHGFQMFRWVRIKSQAVIKLERSVVIILGQYTLSFRVMYSRPIMANN